MSPERAISNRTLIQKEALPPGKLCQRQQTSKGERVLLPFSAQLSKKHFPTLASFPGALAIPPSAISQGFSCILLFPLESWQPPGSAGENNPGSGMQQLFQQWWQAQHWGFLHIFLFCNSLARGDVSTAVGSKEFWTANGYSCSWNKCRCPVPSCWPAGALSTFLSALFTIPLPCFQTATGYLDISLLAPPCCSLTTLRYHHYLQQQWPLLILSRSLYRLLVILEH